VNHLKQLIREVPDFPKPGITFYDITTLLKDKQGFRQTIDELQEHYRGTAVDVVVGIEARGYFFAPAMAHALNAGFVPVRKPKKLPHHVRSVEYELEYGIDTLEVHADAFAGGSRVLLHDDLLALHVAGVEPMLALDEHGRPDWLFGRTVQQGCTRAGFAEHGEFATAYGDARGCLVKLGCKGPVAKCNVPIRGWSGGVGGCPNVGGICIGCTMPGFPDKFMPFMDAPPGGGVSSALTGMYGPMIRKLRGITNKKMNQETKWRHNRPELTTGYKPRWEN